MRLSRSIILTFLCLLAYMGLDAQAPCLQEWQYVRTVNINNVTGTPLSDFQVRLTMNTQALIAVNKMKADGSDIRFTLGDCCTELPVWIQSGINTTTTRIWTKVPLIPPSGSVQIRIYYGNPNASPIDDINSVMSVMGNDSMGTAPQRPNVTITTQQYSFAHPARSVRWRIYSADTANFRFKVANDTNMVTGSSPMFTTPSTPGFYTYDWEGQVVAGGYPGFYSADSLRIMNLCGTPCPGNCGNQTFGNGNLVTFGALDSTICGAFPSLKLWYRRSAFFDPVVTLLNNEFDRAIPFSISAVGPTTICPQDTAVLRAQNIAATTYQWYRDGVLLSGQIDTLHLTQFPGTYHCVATYGTCQTVISDSITVVVNRPALDLGSDTTRCTDTTIVIDAGSGFSSYLWNSGATTQTFEAGATGNYSVMVTDSIGCSVSDTIHVTIYPLPTPELVPNGPVNFCEGGSVVLDAFDPDWYAYIWNVAGITSSNYVVDTPGSYYVVVYDLNGCTDTSETITVTVYQDPLLDLGRDTTLCTGDSILLDAGTWPDIYWAWGFTGETFTVRYPGVYVATVTDTNGCSTIDSVRIEFYDLPVVDLGGNHLICPQDTVQLDAGSGLFSYIWNNGDTSQVAIVGGGYFRVTVTDANGCVGVSNLVSVLTYPETDNPVILGDENGLASTTAVNYQWYWDGVPIPGANGQTFDPDSTGIYYVEVIDTNGCGSFISNSINLTIIYEITLADIPEGFSPNGDGINDFFEIPNLSFFPANSLKIFNRWGQAVYSRTPYNNEFNGISDQGTDLPDGTYFFVLDVGNGQDPFSGSLIINR